MFGATGQIAKNYIGIVISLRLFYENYPKFKEIVNVFREKVKT